MLERLRDERGAAGKARSAWSRRCSRRCKKRKGALGSPGAVEPGAVVRRAEQD